MASSTKIQNEDELSEGFMLYSGFIGSEAPPTPKAQNQSRPADLDLQRTPKQGGPNKMVHARRQSSFNGSFDGNIGQEMPPPGKVNPIGVQDELDDTAYSYALRVAYINRILQQAVSRPSKNPKSPNTLDLASPIDLTSPSSTSGNPKGRNSYFPTSAKAGSSGMIASPTAVSPGGRGVFGRKKERESAKLPKEFLPGFWDVLGNEGGDAVWRTSINTFLSYLPNKKATKTATGLNLREISVLLETFSSVLPSTDGGISSLGAKSGVNPQKHVHVTHLIAVLSTCLQGFYNPMNRKPKDEDKEMHLKIMNELDMYSLRPEAAARQPSSSFYGDMTSPGSEAESPSAKSVSRKSSFISNLGQRKSTISPPPMPTTPSFASSNASLVSDDSFNTPYDRSPSRGSFSREQDRKGSLVNDSGSPVDLIDVVRRVFAIPKDKINHDLDALRRAGLDEKSYLSDLKVHLGQANAAAQDKRSEYAQDRSTSLQAELSALVHARPDLAGMNIASPRSTTAGHAGDEFFFTPNQRKDEVYARLVKQARLTLSYDTPLTPKTTGERELVELCAGVWGIKNKTVTEVGVSFQIWTDCLGKESEEDEMVGNRRMMTKGTPRKRASYTEEFGWAERVLEDLLELAMDIEAGIDTDEQLLAKSTLTTLHNKLAGHVTEAVSSIYPTTALPPIKPPPSCFSLIKALLDSPDLSGLLPDALKDDFWQTAADDLRGAAVGEYVLKQVELLSEGSGDESPGAKGAERSLEGYERLADFVEDGVQRVGKVWPQDRLDGRLNPPQIILSKQLPLFLAELQFLDQPSSGTKADVIFGLYERTARLIHLWDDLCPGEDLAFELEAFFEPHVREWLRGTNEVDTHEWVSRAVALDSWVPEGTLRHSQSVLDLFQFIRAAVTTILVNLPLGEYSRACYLIDFSKTAATSVSQYAKTVESLFMAEMTPNRGNNPTPLEPAPIVGGKAGAWLAKSKQAIQGLERKKVEGFNIPPTACVKLTDMGAARACLEDLGVAMEADETTRIVKEHNLKTNGAGNGSLRSTEHVFTVTVSRGENLLSKSLQKAADAFVSITDPVTSNRLLKSNTTINSADPSWEESFEIMIGGPKILDLACYDRTLLGKHDLIGAANFKLEPATYREVPVRELLVPLKPRGSVYVRLEMEGGERHEVKFHLDRAGRSLDRAGEAMTRCIVDRMGEYIKSQLSKDAIRELLRPLSAKPKKGTMKQTSLSDQDYERSLVPLLDYFDANFSTFAVTLSDKVKLHLMTRLWKRVLDILISTLIPPLSDKETTADPLSSQEINVVFQWLKLLKSFFNACENGIEYGVPLLVLQSGTYKDLLLIGQYMDLPVASLKEKCVAAIKGVGRQSSKSQSLAQSGFTAPGASEDEERTAEILLRILRMRPQTSDFLHNQIGALNDARVRKQTLMQ